MRLFLQVYWGSLFGMTDVAIKVALKQQPKHLQRFVREVAVLKSLTHPNVIRFLGAALQENQVILAMEYMPNGNLWDALAADTTQAFSWYQRYAGHEQNTNSCAHSVVVKLLALRQS